MARRKIPYGPTDTALAKLFEAIGAGPDRVPLIRIPFSHSLAQISNVGHRQFLENRFHEVEKAGHCSPEFKDKISKEITDWMHVQFPVKGKTM